MPRPQKAKPVAHLGTIPKKSDYDCVTTLANAQNVITARLIGREGIDYLGSRNFAANAIRLHQRNEEKEVSGCLAEGQKP